MHPDTPQPNPPPGTAVKALKVIATVALSVGTILIRRAGRCERAGRRDETGCRTPPAPCAQVRLECFLSVIDWTGREHVQLPFSWVWHKRDGELWYDPAGDEEARPAAALARLRPSDARRPPP
jgi:hypothetical protein